MKALKKFFSDESGASMVEYSVLVALIAVACIAVIWALGGEIRNGFTSIQDCLADSANCAPAEE